MIAVTLAATLDTPAAGPLRLALKQAAGHAGPVVVDGRAVERVGLACLQVLAAGAAGAAQAGTGFRIADPSAPLVEMATLAGLASLVTA